MNIKKTIACMALMISTGYSSLMSVGEFEDNLNKAMSSSYSFKDMKSQEPGLYESFKYYRVVEGFVGHWFKEDKGLLSLAIAAGKFGVNTEFMWTLYNVASMGALMVEGIDNLNKSFYQGRESEESVDEITSNSSLEEEPADEVTNGKVKILNLDINSFDETDKATARSIDKKIEEFLQDESSRRSIALQSDKFSIPELILISSNDYYEIYRDAFVGSNRYRSGKNELNNENFKEELIVNLSLCEIKKMSAEEFKEFVEKCHVEINGNKDIKKEINKRRSYLNLTKGIADSIDDEEDKKIAQSISEQITKTLKDVRDYKYPISLQLNKFSIRELQLISSNGYYERYRDAFLGSNRYGSGEDELNNKSFEKELIDAFKMQEITQTKMSPEEFIVFEETLHNDIKSNEYFVKRKAKTDCYFDLIKNIPESFEKPEDKQKAKNIGDKIKQLFEDDNKSYFDLNGLDLDINNIHILCGEKYQSYKKAFIGCYEKLRGEQYDKALSEFVEFILSMNGNTLTRLDFLKFKKDCMVSLNEEKIKKIEEYIKDNEKNLKK